MFKFISIIFIFFINVANCFANEDIYFIENNEIFLENSGNVLQLRENAKQISFENAFYILSRKILDSENYRKLESLSDFEITRLVKDYQIQSEKINEVNYFTDISINFSEEKVKDFFLRNKIKVNILISEEYVIFPIFKKFNTLYLWEKDNYWYDYLFQEYDNQSLLRLYFPEKSHLSKFKISPSNLIEEDIKKIDDFLDFYKKKKAIILYLEENFNKNRNKFQLSFLAKSYKNKKFSEINLLKNQSIFNNTDSSQVELVAKQVILDLENWWKSQIDNLENEDKDFYDYDIVIKSENLKKSLFLENTLKEILNDNDLSIKEINPNFVVYKVLSRLSVERLNLALEQKNLKLQNGKDENLFIIDYY